MNARRGIRREHIVARFDASGAATLSELVPLHYSHAADGLPAHVRAASALRLFDNRLVVVQDDIDALAALDGRRGVRAVLLPPRPSGERVFDDTLGNKREKLDLEACVSLSDGRLVAFGSGSLPARERLVIWNGRDEPVVVAAAELYGALRSAVSTVSARLNIEGAVLEPQVLRLFHRVNEAPAAADSGVDAASAIVDVDTPSFLGWLDGGPQPRVVGLTTVDLGAVRGVSFGFTDAVVLDDARVVVLACAESTRSALSDGPVLGCRVGLLDGSELTTVDVYEVSGRRTHLKLEGIERRLGAASDFAVVADVDRPSAAALLGRLTWNYH